MYCKSGKHYWLNPDDARKCCNGYHRELRVGNVDDCDRIVTLPIIGVSYGYCWIPDKEEESCQA